MEWFHVNTTKRGHQPRNDNPTTPAGGNTSPLLDTQKAASYLNTTVATLANWRCKGIGPRYLKVGAKVLYRLSDIDRWLDANAVEPLGAAR
jgi:hypothetical protein